MENLCAAYGQINETIAAAGFEIEGRWFIGQNPEPRSDDFLLLVNVSEKSSGKLSQIGLTKYPTNAFNKIRFNIHTSRPLDIQIENLKNELNS